MTIHRDPATGIVRYAYAGHGFAHLVTAGTTYLVLGIGFLIDWLRGRKSATDTIRWPPLSRNLQSRLTTKDWSIVSYKKSGSRPANGQPSRVRARHLKNHGHLSGAFALRDFNFLT
ncbi:hypothetical protein GCM10027405_30860 [Arthrobacter alkaliphilus]